MADYEDVYAPDLTEETESTLSGSEQFVMFDSVEGKRAELSTIADYIVENGEIDGSDIPTIVSTIEGNIGTVDTKVGDLTDLETTDKTSAVDAINEVLGKIPVMTKEVTGNPITVDDALGEVDSLTVDLEPVQDLHGYDKPWSGGANKNLLNIGGVVNQTSSRVTYTSDDNFITMNGTKYGNSYALLDNLSLTLPAGTYYAKAFPISGTADAAPSAYVYQDADLTSDMFNNERSFTLSADGTIQFRFALWYDNAVFTNYKVGIVVSKTSGITEWTPYSNICPITGHDSVEVVDTGVNLFDDTDLRVGGGTWTSFSSTHTQRQSSVHLIEASPNTTYTMSMVGGSLRFAVQEYENTSTSGTENPLLNDSGWQTTSTYTFTTTANTHYIWFTFSSPNYSYDISASDVQACKYMVEQSGTASEYSPYKTPVTTTVTLPSTVYGGDVDVTGGAGTEKMAATTFTAQNIANVGTSSAGVNYASMGNLPLAKINGNIIADKYQTTADASTNNAIRLAGTAIYIYDNRFTDLATAQALIGTVQAVYELATPTDLSTTPTSVTLYNGDNVVSADGDMDMVYVRDIVKVIEKLEG